MLTTVEIVFSRPATTHTGANPVVELVFGADSLEDPNGVDPTTGIYRGFGAIVGVGWQQAEPLDVTVGALWQEAQTLPVGFKANIPDAAASYTQFAAPWIMDFELANAQTAVVFGEAASSRAALLAPWLEVFDIPAAGISAGWQNAKAHRDDVAALWDSVLATNKQVAANFEAAQQAGMALEALWQNLGVPKTAIFSAPWQKASLLTSFGGSAFNIGGAAPAQPLQPAVVPLVFCEAYPVGGWPSSVNIAFGVSRCTGGHTGNAPFYILPARFYMQVHDITAELLPQVGNSPGVFIDIPSVTVAADTGSFCRSFSAVGHISLFDQLAPVGGLPQRIRITLDGIAFVFVVGPVRETEAFGKRGVQFSGHSVTKLLSDPYARAGTYFNSTAQTAQQLAENVLQYTGVTLDWGVTDWLVPAGAWSHHGTPLSAVQSIAASIGGYVQSHRTEPVLQVRHPYPLLAGGLPGGPWNWYAAGVTPDVSLASEALMTIGTERRDGVDLNGVDVTGTNQGVWRKVTRIGTAGEKTPGSPVVDPLITADEAASQRGLSILGAAGAKHFIDFELPILTGSAYPGSPGILEVGQLALVNQINHLGQVAPWRGRLRGVSASASFGGKVRQTINVERHLEVAP